MFVEHRLASCRPRVSMAIGLLACAAAWSAPGPSTADERAASRSTSATTIRGQVRDPELRPLADVTVRLLRAGLSARSRSESWVAPVVTRTASDGSFVVAAVTGAEYTLRVEADAYAPFTARGIPAGAALKLHLEPGHALRGRVLDHETGQPLGGARVVACDEQAFLFGEASCRVAPSDAEGRFALSQLPAGPVQLQARAEAHAASDPLSIQLPLAGQPAIELRLRPGARIAGRVLDDEDRPVGDALISFTARSGAEDESSWRGDAWPLYSAADGSFVHHGLPARGRYDLRVRKPGFPPVSAGPYLVETGRDLSDLTVRLHPAAALRLRLVDGDGNPVSDRLTVLDRAARRERSVVSVGTPVPEEQIVVEPDGWYRIEGLEAGTRDFVFRPDRWADVERSAVELRPGRTTDLGPLLVRPGSRIAGRVTDPSGRPIPGARIEALYPSSRGWAQRSAPSDEDGSYELDGLGDEPLLMVQASAAGYGDADRSDVMPGETTVDFVLEPTGAIVGRAVFDDGEPVPVFSVRAHPEARDPLEAPPGGLGLFRALSQSFTSEDGAFRLEGVDSGSYTLELRASGKAPASKPGVAVLPGEIVDVGTITLVDGNALRGRVLDRRDDAPIAGARVVARPQGGWLSQLDESSAVEGVSDAEGSFVIEGLGSGAHAVRVTHAGFAPAELQVLIEPDVPPAALQVHLSEGGTLSGTVRDVEGRPVGDATIGLSPGSVAGGDLRSATTGADGQYRIERIAPGSYQAMRVPDRDGGAVGNLTMKPAVIREGQVTVVDFDDAARITLSGTVRRGAQALPEVNLFFLAGDGGVTATDFKTTRSDATGRYEVGLERAGGYRVIVQSSEQMDFSRAANVEISVPDEPRVDLDIVVRGGTISGSVVDEEGDPVRGASVLATADAAAGRDRVTGVVSDADGRFYIEGLEDGRYAVTASAPGFRVASVHPVTLAGGNAPAVDLRLVRGDALRGRVVDAHGQGLPGALVLVGPSGSTEMSTAASGQTDVNGTFRITAPVDGPLDITAIAAGWAPARLLGVLPATTPEGPEPLLRASPGGRVRIRLLGPEGQPLPSVQLQLRAAPEVLGSEMALLMNPPPLTDGSGTTRVDRLAPGVYEVSLAGAAGPQPSRVTVVEGSETSLEIRLP